MGFWMSTLVRFSGQRGAIFNVMVYGLNRQLNPPWYVFGYNKVIVSRKIPHHTTPRPARLFPRLLILWRKKWMRLFVFALAARFFKRLFYYYFFFLFLHCFNTNVTNKFWKYASPVKLWNKIIYIRWVRVSHYGWILIHAALW